MTKKAILPVQEIVERYLQGETIQSLASIYGVSRATLQRNLKDAGVKLRTTSESQKARAQRQSPEQRSHQAKAAHDAIRGTRKTLEHKIKIALSRQKTQYSASPAEMLLQRWLADRGFQAIPQCAVGPYNVDLLLGNTAIEIYGGNWHNTGHHFKQAYARQRYILDQGLNLIIIWVDRRNRAMAPTCIDAILSFSKQCAHLTSKCCVMTGTGKEIDLGSPLSNKALGIQTEHLNAP